MERLQFLGVNVSAQDINTPQPERIQLICKAFLVKCFDFTEESLTMPQFVWKTTDMTNDADLYARSETLILLLKTMVSVWNDFMDTEATQQFPLSLLLAPTSKEVRVLFNQIADIAQQRTRMMELYDPVIQEMQEAQVSVEMKREKIEQLEAKLQNMKQERNMRERQKNQLREQRARTEVRLKEVADEEGAANLQLEMMVADERRHEEDHEALVDELTIMTNQNGALDYEMVDNPEELKEEVETLREQLLQQQKLCANESREVTDLQQREEQCRHAAKAMERVEDELGGVSTLASKKDRLEEGLAEQKAARDDARERTDSKKTTVSSTMRERVEHEKNHQEEKEQEMQRVRTLDKDIGQLKENIQNLQKEEGRVKKGVVEARTKLNTIKNKKSQVQREANENAASQVAKLNDFKKKYDQKKEAYKRFLTKVEPYIAEFNESFTAPTDLDSTVTTTNMEQTMQLL